MNDTIRKMINDLIESLQTDTLTIDDITWALQDIRNSQEGSYPTFMSDAYLVVALKGIRMFGGSFINHIGNALEGADMGNKSKLISAFHNEFKQYHDLCEMSQNKAKRNA